MTVQSAFMVYAKRIRCEYDKARENVEWLQQSSPRYACGELVSAHDKNHLLRLNQNKVAYIEKNCRSALEETGMFTEATHSENVSQKSE